MNQMNIWTRGSFFAKLIAVAVYARCCESVTPRGSPGFVSWPYSVIQIGIPLRWNHVSSEVSKRGSDGSVTLGQRTRWSGFMFGTVGYGWWAQASNLSLGSAFATNSANLPGERLALTPRRSLSRPRAEVSPIATCAALLPALMPAYVAR